MGAVQKQLEQMMVKKRRGRRQSSKQGWEWVGEEGVGEGKERRGRCGRGEVRQRRGREGGERRRDW